MKFAPLPGQSKQQGSPADDDGALCWQQQPEDRVCSHEGTPGQRSC